MFLFCLPEGSLFLPPAPLTRALMFPVNPQWKSLIWQTADTLWELGLAVHMKADAGKLNFYWFHKTHALRLTRRASDLVIFVEMLQTRCTNWTSVVECGSSLTCFGAPYRAVRLKTRFTHHCVTVLGFVHSAWKVFVWINPSPQKIPSSGSVSVLAHARPVNQTWTIEDEWKRTVVCFLSSWYHVRFQLRWCKFLSK